jgi:hypothetical protein
VCVHISHTVLIFIYCCVTKLLNSAWYSNLDFLAYLSAFIRAGLKLEKIVSILLAAGPSGNMLIYSQYFDKNKNKTKNYQEAKFSVARVLKFKLHVVTM